LYGFSNYTDVWSTIKRGYPGFDLLPVRNLLKIAEDVARYPDLKVFVMACWTELVLSDVDGLSVTETILPLVDSVFNCLLELAKTRKVKVR